MIVEKLKYTIWASDAERAAAFYTCCFDGHIVRQNPHITEIAIAGGLIAFFGEDVIRRLLDGVRPGWESDLRTVRDRHLGQVAGAADALLQAKR